MNIIENTKNIIREFDFFKKYCAIKKYSYKNKVTLFESLFECKAVNNDLSDILSSAKINNVGCGAFFYSLDETIQVITKGRIFGNIPIDYSFVLENGIKEKEVKKSIEDYIERTNDSRLSLSSPNNLESALQAILFWNSILWQTGHRLVGLGRLDKVLDKYELPETAETLICDFLRTLHVNYEYKSNLLKGDTGQIIILGGTEEDGTYFVNEYTYLFLKCLKKVNLPDPKILLRVSKEMPKALLELAVDVISSGIGSPLLSNDDKIIPLLVDFGYSKKDAYNYGTSACWEPLSIGNSMEQNNLIDIRYGKCINETICDNLFVECKSMDAVYKIFNDKLAVEIEDRLKIIDSIIWEQDRLLSALMGLETDISKGGAKYNNYGILTVGISSAVNSLINIEEFVFKKGKYSLQDIKNIIISNYSDGVEDFKKNEFGFGTESSLAIYFTNKIIKSTEELLTNYRNKYQGKIKFGLSSPNYITISYNIGATLDGRRAGEPFQTHISRDNAKSITEIIHFVSELEFSAISSNANVLDVMVQSSLMKEHFDKFVAYILGGIRQGFFQMQINVLSYSMLVDARTHPERYPNLIVRVWGFNAYFNDLPEEYKDNLIRRAQIMEETI